MPITTKDEAVAAGVDAFQQAEVRLRKAQEDLMALAPIFETAASTPLLMMGTLQSKRMQAAAKAIAGLVSRAEEQTWALHREATDIAIKNGVDVVQPAGGGGR